jgi:hypothetical protein
MAPETERGLIARVGLYRRNVTADRSRPHVVPDVG